MVAAFGVALQKVQMYIHMYVCTLSPTSIVGKICLDLRSV